jgi:hypothetical protein
MTLFVKRWNGFTTKRHSFSHLRKHKTRVSQYDPRHQNNTLYISGLRIARLGFRPLSGSSNGRQIANYLMSSIVTELAVACSNSAVCPANAMNHKEIT